MVETLKQKEVINKNTLTVTIHRTENIYSKKNLESLISLLIKLKNEEDNLVKQKNILKEEQYGLKISELKNKYNSYQEFKNKKNNELKNLRDNAGNKVLKIINDILAKYANENNISLILEKKNVVIGKTELDISKEILKILNNEIRYIELK